MKFHRTRHGHPVHDDKSFLLLQILAAVMMALLSQLIPCQQGIVPGFVLGTFTRIVVLHSQKCRTAATLVLRASRLLFLGGCTHIEPSNKYSVVLEQHFIVSTQAITGIFAVD